MNRENENIAIELYGDKKGMVQLIESMGSDETIVRSARVSFGNDSKKDRLDEKDIKLIKYLLKNKHTSVFEHCAITFKFTVPLFVRSQHHRHRTWSYNEISRRYTEKDLSFYLPKEFRTQHPNNRQASNVEALINPEIGLQDGVELYCCTNLLADDIVELHSDISLKIFNKLIEAGICREQARMVLPQNLYTEYWGTCNLINLLKFIDLRTHEGAQWEIQQAAKACLEIAKHCFPQTIQIYEELK